MSECAGQTTVLKSAQDEVAFFGVYRVSKNRGNSRGRKRTVVKGNTSRGTVALPQRDWARRTFSPGGNPRSVADSSIGVWSGCKETERWSSVETEISKTAMFPLP